MNPINSINPINSNNSITQAILMLFFIIFFSPSVYAADKTWVGSGDASTWADQKNWLPSGVPTSADDITIDFKDSSVTAGKTFETRTLIIGGASASAFATDNFIYGGIAPSSASDDALYIRKDGIATLKGEGTITLKGKFKNTEEALIGEESFIFILE